MSNAKDSAFKKLEKNLFRSSDEISGILSEQEIQRKNRTLFCVTKKMDNPLISDKELVEFLTSGCEGTLNKVSLSTAYRDVATVTRITGNIQQASKSWIRYMVVETAKRAIAIAEKLKDPKGMAANLNIIGKYMMVDKEDNEFNFDQIVPPSFEPTDDISILGGEYTQIKDLEKERERLRNLFGKNSKIEDAHIITDDNTQ